MNLSILFIVIAMLCFIADAAGIPTGRVKLISVGLAFWAASLLVSGSIKTP